MATAVPNGMRSMAARNRHVMAPVVTPSPTRAGMSRRSMDLSAGRASARKISAPALSRSHAVPAGPTWAISGSDSAAPSCTENMAVTAIIQCRYRQCPPSSVGHCRAARLAMNRRAMRTSGPSRLRCSVNSSAAAITASSVSGSRASRTNRAAVVSSRNWVRRAWRQFHRRQVTLIVAPHHLAGIRALDDRLPAGDGVELLGARGADQPRRAVVAAQVLPPTGI